MLSSLRRLVQQAGLKSSAWHQSQGVSMNQSVALPASILQGPPRQAIRCRWPSAWPPRRNAALAEDTWMH